MAVDEVVVRAILKDELSRPLERVGAEVQRVDKKMVSAQKATAQWNAQMRTFEQRAGGFNGSVARMSVSVARFAGQDLRLAALGVAGLGVTAVGAGLKTAGSFEQARLSLETMLGSVQAGDAMFKQMQDFATKSPFDALGVVQAGEQLLAYGTAAKDILPTLTAIGDAAAGLGKGSAGIDAITRAIGQMTTKGRVQGDELLQLSEAGIPALKILANQYGVTTSALQDMITAGNVDAATAVPKLLSGMESGTHGVAGPTVGFGGLMDKQSKTFFGMLSEAKDTILNQLAEAFRPLMDNIKSLLPAFTNSLSRFVDGAAPALSNIAVRLLDMLSNGLPSLQALVVPILGAIGDMLSSPVMGQVGLSLASFVTQFVPQIPVLVDAFMQLVGILPDLVNLLADLLPIVKPMAKVSSMTSQGVHTLLHPGSSSPQGLVSAFEGATNPLTLIPKLFTHDPAAVNPYTSDSGSSGGALPYPALPIGGPQVTVHVNNPQSNVDVASAVQQGIQQAEDKKKRRG